MGEILSSRRGSSELALDHAPMEEEQRVLRPQVQGLVRVPQGLLRSSIREQLPRQRVGNVHALPPCPFGLRGGQAGGQIDAMVRVEQRDLEVHVDPIGLEQPLLHVDQRVLLGGVGGAAGLGVQVSQRDDVLGKRIAGDHRSVAGDGPAELTAGPRHLGQADLRGERSRIEHRSPLVENRRAVHATAVPIELAELVAGPGGVGSGPCGLQGQVHGSDGVRRVALKLPGVRRPGVGREVRPEVDRSLERLEGLWVLPQLDLSIADDRKRVGVVGIDGRGPAYSEKNSGFAGTLEHRRTYSLSSTSVAGQPPPFITRITIQAHCRPPGKSSTVSCFDLV